MSRQQHYDHSEGGCPLAVTLKTPRALPSSQLVGQAVKGAWSSGWWQTDHVLTQRQHWPQNPEQLWPRPRGGLGARPCKYRSDSWLPLGKADREGCLEVWGETGSRWEISARITYEYVLTAHGEPEQPGLFVGSDQLLPSKCIRSRQG